MYIIKNAFKSIARNKARNILIGVIVLYSFRSVQCQHP